MQKAVQRSLLDFLQSKLGLILLVCGALWCINTALGVLHLLITTSTSPLCPHCAQHDYSDTLGTGGGGANSVHHMNAVLPTGFESYEHTLCYEPIDVVYTWVNGSDPKLIADLAYWKARYADVDEGTAVVAAQLAYNATLNVTSASESEDQAGANRFRDNQELRFSLRSIWKYAPWVRHVWIVTNGHVPYWLNLDHPRVTLISHSDIFPNTSHLPTFSSPAIETHLHRIPGIASKFIYFNDDVMLGNHITPDDFVTHGGGQKIFLSWNVPNCATGCPDTWLADNYCDSACNNKACEWDMGDCVNSTKGTGTDSSGGRDARYGNWESSRGGSAGSKYCATGCPNNWVGDKVCDRSCKNAECAFDGGDCGLELIKTHLVSVDLPASQHSYETLTSSDGSQVIMSGNEFLLPFGTASLYVNLSTAFPGVTSIVDASHDNPSLIRSAIVTQNLKVLTLILYDEVDIEENAQTEEEEAMALAAAGSNVTAGIEASSASLGSTRRVEIFLQGDLNGVMTNRTFNLTRPRFPSPEELAAAALEAEAAAAASSTGARDDRIVEDPDAMFAQTDAAAAAAAAEQNTRGGIHAAEAQGAAATNANSQLRQADSAASAAVHDAASSSSSSSSSDEPIPLSAGIGVSASDEEEEQNPTMNSRRRRLLSAFDSLVGTLRALGKDAKGSTESKASSNEQPVDPSAPYQPPAGYSSSSSSSHTRAYTSSPSSHRSSGPASYSSERFLKGGNSGSTAAAAAAGDGFWRESWRDMPVWVDSVPMSPDIAHSGVKLREGLDETRRTQPGENLWQRHSSEEASSTNPSDGGAFSSPVNALRDSTGRILEAYGWSSEDHSLAASIRQHKQKQLWLSMREDARQGFMQAWRLSMREKRKEQEGRWERFVDGDGATSSSSSGGHHEDHPHDSTFIDPSSSSHTPSPSSSRSSPLSRFARDPVWPWELSSAAPDLFSEWDWAAEARRFGRNEARLERRRAKVRQRERERMGGKQPFDGFEFEIGSDGASSAAGGSGALDDDLDDDDDDLELDLSLFGLPPPSEEQTANTDGANTRTQSSSSSSHSPSSVHPDDFSNGSPRSLIDLSLPPGSGPRRTLLGEYGDSLRWVNRLYTREFGKETRKAPAHMPHMIDVAIENELQGRWPELFEDTSSHRFRHSHDMQYSFSYFYYLMNVPRAFDFHRVWREQLDLNGDGVLDELEIRYLTLWLSGKKILPRDLVKMHEKLLNATRIVHGDYPYATFNHTDPPQIDMQAVSRATEVMELIEDKWSSLRKYKFELVNLDQIEFYMVPDNTTKVQLRLDEIRAKMPKFICLNDDMNKTADPPAETLQVLRDFYTSYFPTPCPFELPSEQRNPYLYVSEWRAARQQGVIGKWWRDVSEWWRGEGKKTGAGVSTVVGGAADATNTLLLSVCTLAAIGLLFLLSKSNLLARVKRALRSPRSHHHRSA